MTLNRSHSRVPPLSSGVVTRVAGLVLVLASTALTLLLLEGLVRVLDLPPRPLAPLPMLSYRLSDNPVIGYEYVPGHRASDGAFYASHRGFEINTAGFRDRDYSLTKSEGTYRILVLGDSTTAGNGVFNLDDTYPKILERSLRTLGPPGRVYEVLNMGVGGYHTLQEVETLRVKGLAYDPDLVLLTVCMNDFDPHADGGVYELLRALAASRATAGPSLLGALLRHSRLAFVVYHRMRALLEPPDAWSSESLRGRSTVRAGLELLSELQQAHHFQVRVLVLPAFDASFDHYRHAELHRRIHEAAAGLPGIVVVDLLEAFASHGNNARALSYDHLHMNERGHRLMAKLILPVVTGAALDR
jgi:lysophospholipase L1-like esterase